MKRLVRKVMKKVGQGYSYETALQKVIKKEKLVTVENEARELREAVYRMARKRKQITRKEASRMIDAAYR